MKRYYSFRHYIIILSIILFSFHLNSLVQKYLKSNVQFRKNIKLIFIQSITIMFRPPCPAVSDYEL